MEAAHEAAAASLRAMQDDAGGVEEVEEVEEVEGRRADMSRLSVVRPRTAAAAPSHHQQPQQLLQQALAV